MDGMAALAPSAEACESTVTRPQLEHALGDPAIEASKESMTVLPNQSEMMEAVLPLEPKTGEESAVTVELINMERRVYPEIEQNVNKSQPLSSSLLPAGDESEHTDDEFLDVERLDEEQDGLVKGNPTGGQIAIFEYNEEGLMRKSHLSLESKDFEDSSEEEEVEQFQCRNCDKVCSTWASFRLHLKSHSSEDMFSCPLCPKTFQTKNFVERHVRAFHYKERPYICRFCGKGFSTEWYCQKHENHHEKGTGPRITARDKKHTCKFCEKQFPNLRQLQMHESTHTGEKSYSCSHCLKTFSYSSSLLKHIKSVHSDKPSICVYCNKLYSTEEGLFKHRQHHIGINQFKCLRCEKIFPDMLSLKRHGRAVHYDEVERPHLCHLCEKRFSQRSMLEAHLLCHTGEKPFLCPTCGKTFRQKSQLKTHSRCHSSDRPFACETCGKAFSSSATLLRHERTHSYNTEDKKHICTICQKSFPQLDLLTQHMSIHKPLDNVVSLDVNNSTGQDAEILALALKSFVQSMTKAQGVQNSHGIHSTDDSKNSQEEQELNIDEVSSQDCSKADDVASTTIVTGQSITSTKLQTTNGPVEILSLSIEEGIHPIASASSDQARACHTTEGGPKPDGVETDPVLEKAMGTGVNINNLQASSDLTLNLKEMHSVNMNLHDNYIAQSIMENPNMERIRQKYSRKPQMVETLLLSDNADDVEIQNALNKLGVSGTTSEGEMLDSRDTPQEVPEGGIPGLEQSKVDRADESEATDDEPDAGMDWADDNEQSSTTVNSNDKVYVSLSIFEYRNNGLVCVQKVNMFEPKYHKRCEKCDKRFFSLCGYETHMKKHSAEPELPYICQYCGRGFASIMSVKAHEAAHTGNTLYKCKFCPREFRNYSSHRIHTATHSGLKPYLCQYCNKPFAQLGHVQRHERTHTGQRPYACEFCDKAFAEWGTWQRHTRTHTGERPYVCPTCGKGFIVKFSLRRHMKTHEKAGPGGGGGMTFNHGHIRDAVSTTGVAGLIDGATAHNVQEVAGLVFSHQVVNNNVTPAGEVAVMIEGDITTEVMSNETHISKHLCPSLVQIQVQTL